MDKPDFDFAKHSRLGSVISAAGVFVMIAAFILFALRDKTKTEEIEQISSTAKTKDSINTIVLDTVKTQLKNINLADRKIRVGVKYATSGHPKEALDAYTEAIELDKTNPLAYDYRGYLYFRLGNYERAVNDLENSVKIDSNYVWGHYNLSLAYWATGAEDKAIVEIRKVIAIDSSFRNVIKKDGQFNKFRSNQTFRTLIRN